MSDANRVDEDNVLYNARDSLWEPCPKYPSKRAKEVLAAVNGHSPFRRNQQRTMGHDCGTKEGCGKGCSSKKNEREKREEQDTNYDKHPKEEPRRETARGQRRGGEIEGDGEGAGTPHWRWPSIP